MDSVEARNSATATAGQGRKALVVLGMHRSGTSAMTRLLSLAGAALPERIMTPGPDNPVGYWEPWEAVAFNDGVLSAVDSAWDDIFAVAGGPRAAAQQERFLEGALAFIEQNFRDGEPLIVLKDPRSSVLAGLWDAALRAKDYEPVYVTMVRHPLEIAGSLGARDRFPTEKSTLLWLSYMLAAERDTRGAARIFVSYEQMLADWRGVLDRVEAVAGLALPGRSAEAAAAIDGFLAPDLRHHALDAEALAGNPQVWDGVRVAYEVFEAAARTGEVDRPRLEAVTEAFAGLDAAVGPVLADMRRRTDQALRFRSLQDRAQAAQVEILKRELAAARGVADRAAAAAELALARGRAEAEAHAAREAELQAELATARRRAEDLEQDLGARLARLSDEVEAVRASTSWKLTAPLRRAVLAMQRLGPGRPRR